MSVRVHSDLEWVTGWCSGMLSYKGPDGAESGEFLGPVLYQFVRNRDLKNIECP